MSDKEKMLQEAIEAGQAGDLPLARELLLKLLRTDNQEPLYWLLMSTAVDSREERVYCLHNVLKLDPENSAAKHDLNLLAAPLPTEEALAFEPEQQEDWETSEIAAPAFEEGEKPPKEEPWPISWIMGSLGIGLVIILLGYYAASNGLLGSNNGTSDLPSESSPSVSPVAPTNEATLLPQPTETNEIVVAPRDPQELLSATHTPTPRYVNTPHEGSEAYMQGMLAFEAGDWKTAISRFQDHIASEPASADVVYYIGESNLRLEDFEAATIAFTQSISIDQQFAPAYLGRAQAQLALGNNDSSVITDLNTAVLLDSDFVEAYISRAEYFMEKADYERALDDLSTAEDLAPLSAIVHAYKARSLSALENYELALPAAQRAMELDVTFMPNYPILANAHLQLGQFDDAITILQSYLTFEAEDGEAWQLLGLAFQNNGELESAFGAFDRALDLDTNLPIAAYYMGLNEQEEGNNSGALSFFRIAVSGAPDWFEARIALAQALLQSGDPGGAFFEINASSSLAESDEQLAAFHYWRANILEILGQAETALPDWLSLLELPSEVVPEDWLQTAEQRTQAQ